MGRQAFSLEAEELASRARAWVNVRAGRIRHVVCGHPITSRLKSESIDRDGVAALADVIATIVAGVAPITIAVLVARVGVKRLYAESVFLE